MVDPLQELLESKALLEGHFLLTSGRHSSRYIQCARLLQYPDRAAAVISVVAEKLENIDFTTVIAPALGGIIVSYELAKQLNKKSLFTERQQGEMQLRRGFEISPGEKIIIAEDVITTGKSVLEVAAVVNKLGGEVIGYACIVDRSGGSFPHPLTSALTLELETYSSENCPLCRQGIPAVKPGSRR